MRNHFKDSILGLGTAALALSSVMFAQTARPQPSAAAKVPKAAPAPARLHDITGDWIGSPGPTIGGVGAMTAWGKAQFDSHKPFNAGSGRIVPVGDSNDPLIKCDPLGFPRNVFFETRGIEFVPTPSKMLELFQYQRIWREIWTDGRALPKNVGGDEKGAPDPRWYGYAIGHWDGDAFVAETAGLDERSWLDAAGDPHSPDLRVEERYRRVDHDNLELIVKIDDPKAYTKPFVTKAQILKWNPKRELDEQMCVPSEAEAYLNAVGGPAGGNKR